MSLLDDAITSLAAEVNALQQNLQAKVITPNSADWWTLQAKALGLSYLRTLQAQGVTDPVVADQLRKGYRKELQLTPDVVANAVTASNAVQP